MSVKVRAKKRNRMNVACRRSGVGVSAFFFAGLLVFAACSSPEREEKDKPAPAPASEAYVPPGTLVLERPENNGYMNLIPSFVELRLSSSLLSLGTDNAQVLDLANNPVSNRFADGKLMLVGGDRATVSLPPGTYTVSFITPIRYQNAYPVGSGKARDWVSEKRKVTIASGESVALFVAPAFSKSSYTGAWLVSDTASGLGQ